MASLQISEIYRSIQGESTWAGWPCSFVRTGGCDIRCGYCDEPHALRGGVRMSVDEVLRRVAELGVPLVEIAGGEPLLQPAVPELVRRLLEAPYRVLVETGGHRRIGGVPVVSTRCLERAFGLHVRRWLRGGVFPGYEHGRSPPRQPAEQGIRRRVVDAQRQRAGRL